MTSPAQLIADNLAALPHPDGAARQLAGYSTTLLPQALADQVKQTAVEVGEAVVHLLTLNGYRIVTDAELAVPPAGAEPVEVANLHCTLCDTRLLSINLVNPSHALTDGRTFVSAVSGLSPECPHSRKP